MKIWHVSAVLAFLVTCASAMIKLVGPDESTEDLSKPIKHEYEITFYRFKAYFDDGNTQWPVFNIARKYYVNKDANITFANFIQAGKEYIIADLLSQQLSFHSLGHLITKIQPSLVYYLNEIKNQTFNLEEFFKHTCHGRFRQFMKVGIDFKDQPWEVQQKMMHTLDMKKRKDMFAHAPHHQDHDETYIYGHKSNHRDLDSMRKEEIGRRFRDVYGGVEWIEDGRRVTDPDYDLEHPTENRTLHRYAQTRENSTKEVVDELLALELDLDL